MSLRSPLVKRWLPAFAAVWVTLVVVAFYAVNKPFSLEATDAIVRLVLNLGGLAAILSLGNLIGRLLCGELDRFEPIEQFAVRTGLGLGVLSVLLLGLGALNLLSSTVLWLTVLLPLPASLNGAVRDLRALRSAGSRMSAAWWFVVVAAATALLMALAPATAWDALVYQLTGPKLYLEQGALAHPIDLPYLGFPKTGSMLFTLGLALGGAPLAQLLHLSFVGLTLCLVPGLTNKLAPGRAGLAAAIVLGVPSMWLVASSAYVEWMVAFWVLAGFMLIQRDPGPGWRTTALAGLCAGFGLATKYTAVWLVVGLAVVAALNYRSLRRLATFVAAAAIALLPSLLVNLWLTRNPVYPFVFSGIHWDAHRTLWFSRFGSGLSIPQLLIAWWDSTVFGLEGGYYIGHPSYGATIGPILLALVPLALLRLARPAVERAGSLRDVVVMIAVGGAGWMAQLAASALLVQTRLLFPLFPFLAAAAVAGYQALGELSRRVQFVLGGLLVFVFAVTLLGYPLSAIERGAPGVVTGNISQEEYLTRNLGAHYQAMREINDLPNGAQVRFLWEPRSYYCAAQVTCEPDALLDRWWHTRQHEISAETALSAWEREGVTHVLFYRDGADAVRQAGFDPLTDADWEELAGLLARLGTPVADIAGAYQLYAIAGSPDR